MFSGKQYAKAKLNRIEESNKPTYLKIKSK